MFQNSFENILPEFFFTCAILIILVYGTLYNASAYFKYPIMTNSVGYLSIQSLLITLFLIINNPKIGPSSQIIFNNVLIMDDFTTFIGTIIILGSTATLLISLNYTLNQKMSARINEYMVLILFSTLSMLLLISSYDLISMYLAIELQSLAFYVLAAFQRNNEFSTEAGLKYFILGALASGLLLFGESLIYGFTGLTNFEELAKFLAVVEIPGTSSATALESSAIIPWFPFFNFTYIEILIIGLFFIIIAFLFKISAVPFHLWTPDVYEGAPTTVTAFFSITPKIAIIGLLLRLCMYTFYDFAAAWQNLIIFSAFLSMFIGTLGAINQNKIKRLLAYSSIAHVGYILIGLATGTIESIEALLVYTVLYTLTILNIFSVILVMAREKFNLNEAHIDTIPPTIKYQTTTERLNITSDAHLDNFGQLSLDGTISTQSTNPLSALSTTTFARRASVVGASKVLPDTLNFNASKIKVLLKPNLESNLQLSRACLLLGNPIWDPYYSLKQNRIANRRNQTVPSEGRNKQKQNTRDIVLNNTNEKNINFQPDTENGLNTKLEHNVGSVNSTGDEKTYIKHITDFSKLAKTNPILAFTAAIVFFSNAGIPPLAGFYGKLNIFLTAVENSMYFLAISGILCSVIGTFYSIRLVKIIYYHSLTNTNWSFFQPINKENALILALTFFFTLFFFLSPSFLFIAAHSASISLCS